MEKYNLDEKGGFFKPAIKSPAKVVKNGDSVELKHFSVFDIIKSTVFDVGENSLKIKLQQTPADVNLSAGDHVVLNYNTSNEVFVISGEIFAAEKTEPIEISLRVNKIEKLKDLVKEKKHYVSFPAQLKIIGIPEIKPAVVKNISFGGIKLNCDEDVQMEDVMDVTIKMDKVNKMNFKGRVVRKNKIGSSFEYGLEYSEMMETSSKLLTRFIYDFESRL